MSKPFGPNDFIRGERLDLRLCRESDCGERYLAWLEDPLVNRYLETRWTSQTTESIRGFVRDRVADPTSFLFAILTKSELHIGNIKLGPVHPIHQFADVSYFIGDRDYWGKGYATEAIQLTTEFGFKVLGLHRVQAGVHSSNLGSARALEKCGYRLEGRLREKLAIDPGVFEDHLFYGQLSQSR